MKGKSLYCALKEYFFYVHVLNACVTSRRRNVNGQNKPCFKYAQHKTCTKALKLSNLMVQSWYVLFKQISNLIHDENYNVFCKTSKFHQTFRRKVIHIYARFCRHLIKVFRSFILSKMYTKCLVESFFFNLNVHLDHWNQT